MALNSSIRVMSLLAALGLALHPGAVGQGGPPLTPEQRAAQQALQEQRRVEAVEDRQRMMDLLGLPGAATFPPAATDPTRPQHLAQREGASTNNWYDEAGNTHVLSSWGIWSNYDESKAGGYRLPDPLVTRAGQPVTSARMWREVRRPEILEDFSREIYGRIPANTPAVSFALVETDATTYAGRAVVKRVLGTIDNSSFPAANPRVELTIYMPPNVTAPVPVVVRIGGGGFVPGPAAPAQAGGAQPAQLNSVAQQVLALGWAFATFNPGAIQADNGAGLDEGIIGLVNRGEPRQPEQWGSLAAWSWGLSRVLDYFESDPLIDVRRSAVQGHSRYGKTALLAGALDERWGMVFSSCSGAMGASLEMRHWGETIDNVAGPSEYHWMAGNFLKYGGNWQSMPVDAHSLVALVAPRPIFITGGTTDQWSDPHGEFLAAAAADPVYRLLGAGGLGQTTMPAPDVSLISGALAFRNHEGGHTDAPDWPVFLEFAQRHFGPGGSVAAN